MTTAHTDSKDAALTHYSELDRVLKLEAVNAELVAALRDVLNYTDLQSHAQALLRAHAVLLKVTQ